MFSAAKPIAASIRDAVDLFPLSAASAMGNRRPGEAVRLFVRLVDQGKYRDAVMMFPQALVSSVGLDRLENILYSDSQELRGHGGVVGVDVNDDLIAGGSAVVLVSIRYRDGFCDSERMTLVRERGDWKIDMTR
jgi:hypothetical protein